MKIWIVETGEPLLIEENVRLHRNGNLSIFLASKGHEVTQFTSTFSHTEKKNFFNTDESIKVKGVTNIFIKTPGYKKNVSLQRIYNNKLFSKLFYKKAKDLERPDIILAPIPVIENAKVALRLAREKGTKLAIDVRDNWPDEIVKIAPPLLQPMASCLFYKAKRSLEEVLNQCDQVIGVSLTQTNYGKKFLTAGKKTPELIPLGYPQQDKKEVVRSVETERVWTEKIGLKHSKFSVSFVGNISRYFCFSKLFEAALELPEVSFFLAGRGDYYEKYKSESKNIPNIIWLDWINKSQIQALLSQSSVGLAHYNNDNFSLPNKPFEYLSFGLPIIHSIKGELKGYVEQYQCGQYFDFNDSKGLVKAIEFYLNNPEITNLHGKNSKVCFSENFSYDIVFEKYENLLLGLVN